MDARKTQFAKVVAEAGKMRLANHEKACGVCKEKGPELCIIRAAMLRHLNAAPAKSGKETRQ